MRFIVEEAVTGNILTRDLKVLEPKFTRMVSGPCHLEFTLPYDGESPDNINLKPYGQLIHVEETINGVRKILGSCIVQPATQPDPSGVMKVVAEGFSGYADGIPWLDNYNPIAVDPFHIVHRIWNHIQTQPQGNLNVTVTPADSNTLLLPGFSWDGSSLVINLFAIFVRAIDFRDCATEMKYWARDIPFEYLEVSEWSPDHTVVNKSLVLAYPRRGVQRTELAFQFGVNVIEGSTSTEAEIDYASQVIVRGWFPGQVYNGDLINADPTRFRRVIMQEDANINSQERAQVAAKRFLVKHQIPTHWTSIIVDMTHQNAPLGSFEVGDDILVEGFVPRYGKVREWHRIISYTIQDNMSQCQLELKHIDAFNYDPISILDTTP